MQYVPVLYDFAFVVETKDINACVVLISRPRLMTVENDVVAIREHSLECHLFAGIFGSHSIEVVDKGFFSVRNVWVVLDVLFANELFYRLT